MPPIRKYNKEYIIEVAYKIVEYDGLDGLNARKLAKKLNCSVQPIFHNFSSMKELSELVLERVYETYRKYMMVNRDDNQYLAMGLNYIKFAQDYPEVFKILFMSEYNMDPVDFILNDDVTMRIVIKNLRSTFDLDENLILEVHKMVYIFTHGLASLVAMKTVVMSDEEIRLILKNAALDIINGIKNREGNKK